MSNANAPMQGGEINSQNSWAGFTPKERLMLVASMRHAL